MAAGHAQLGPDSPFRPQKGKRPQTAGLALGVPSPEEEDPRVSGEAGMDFEAGALPGVLRQARLPEDRDPNSVVHRDMGRNQLPNHQWQLIGALAPTHGMEVFRWAASHREEENVFSQ